MSLSDVALEPTLDASGEPCLDGRISYREGFTWFRVYGDDGEPDRLPVLCLHGGPGAAHDSLVAARSLAATGRRVIFHDQYGCGRSSLPGPRPGLWNVELFVEELAEVRRALDLDRIHILGHSWGGMLAVEHLFTRPEGIASVVLASAPMSIPQWESEANRLLDAFGPDFAATVRRHEAAGTLDDPEYLDAMAVFRARHFAARRPQPTPWRPPEGVYLGNDEVNRAMYGPLVFTVLGNFREWNVIDRLGEIDVPVLVTCGRDDMATPEIADTAHRGIAGSEMVIFEHSAHVPHADEPELFTAVVADFIARHEP